MRRENNILNKLREIGGELSIFQRIQDRELDLLFELRDYNNFQSLNIEKLISNLSLKYKMTEDDIIKFFISQLYNLINGFPNLIIPRIEGDFSSKELYKGIQVEYEHTKFQKIAELIARAHLNESEDYYKALDKMEKNLGIDE